MVTKPMLQGRQGGGGTVCPDQQASTCTLHMHTIQAESVLLESPGQGMQHSGSAVLHSGTGNAPDSSDEQILQDCRANCSAVPVRTALNCAAGLQD